MLKFTTEVYEVTQTVTGCSGLSNRRRNRSRRKVSAQPSPPSPQPPSSDTPAPPLESAIEEELTNLLLGNVGWDDNQLELLHSLLDDL